MSYANPVIPGFYPDPSVCRNGEDYYLVTSSFEYFPGVPVFHSRDLVNWKQIGHCLTRPSQLPLEGATCSSGIYAPTIRYHNGVYFMVTTNVTARRHLIVHTTDPAGEWSEPVWIDFGGIDPDLFFDDDGKVYLTTNAHGITQVEINPFTGEFLSAPRGLWFGTGGAFQEAPHLYKVGGKYYLILSEGGTEYGHMVTMARADHLCGPWEACPANPILTHRSLNHPIQAIGHADLIQDHHRKWWVFFLGIRPFGYPPVHTLGRETFLSPLHWHDGWPVIHEGKPVELEMNCSTLAPQKKMENMPRDDFDSPKLDLTWNHLRNARKGSWSLTARPGWLRLNGHELTLDEDDAICFLGRRQQHFSTVVKTKVDASALMEGCQAGITAYMNHRHHFDLFVKIQDGKIYICQHSRIGFLSKEICCMEILDRTFELEIKAEKTKYTFTCTLTTGERIAMGDAESKYLGKEVAGGFTGVYLAVYAQSKSSEIVAQADFDYFEYSPFEG